MDGRFYRRSRMHRAVGANLMLMLLCVLLFVSHAFAQLPYTPSSLLYASQQNGSFAYLLRTTEGRTEFISIDVSEKVGTGDSPYKVLLEETPFNNDDEVSAYVPVIDQNGIIKVYTGECREPESAPLLWTFKPDSESSTGNGTWDNFSAHASDGQASSVATGPNFLSAGFAYSVSNTTESSLFAFAGMCPDQSDSSDSWTSAANYSQTLTVLDPCDEDHCYGISTTGDRAPPIPEAGFTITPLHATTAYVDDELRQQQDFLLIGGHTQQAFINMSELAIFSAPQNSWSFVTVESEIESSRTDLAVRATAMVEPRSGHTAVLSPDGSKVIVFGGWVGNTSVAAEPQLAILEIGGGFVGTGEWSWTVPSADGGPKDLGVYGHGATMLPGGIMMIAGGYEISQLSKRTGSGPKVNSQIYLYDTASGAWTSSYENPHFSPSPEASDGSSSSSSSSSSSRKTGLGVGIGLGVPVAAALGVLFFYFWRRRGVRRSRDNEIRKLALGAQRAHFWGRGDSEMASSIRNPSSRNSFSSDYPWSGNNPRSTGKRPNWNDNGDAAAERTGLLGDIHVPKKLNRPILNAGVYRPPYNEHSRGDTAGIIHPIDEREEDEADQAERSQARDTTGSLSGQAFVTARNTRVDDLRPPGAEPTSEVGMSRSRSLSPDKDERTSSGLSDSTRSENSAKPAATVKNGLPASHTNKAILFDQHAISSHHNRDAVRSQGSSTSTNSSSEKRYSSDSYSTAHSTLSQRQAEGEYLLSDSDNHEPPSLGGLFNSKPPSPIKPKASEWIGGIRRVLSVSRRRAPTNEGSGAISRASGIDGGDPIIGVHTVDSRFPRRSVSASAELFRRKQGAKDWGVGNRLSQDMDFQSARSTRDDFGLDGHVDLGDEEWDVEGAAEGRRVQVTFTVPKEKLRVVNASAGDFDDLSVNSVSRSNSSS